MQVSNIARSPSRSDLLALQRCLHCEDLRKGKTGNDSMDRTLDLMEGERNYLSLPALLPGRILGCQGDKLHSLSSLTRTCSIRRWFYQIWFEHKQYPFSSCSYVQKERYLHLSQNTTLCYSHISASQLTYHLVTPHGGVHKNAIWLRRACDLPATWLSWGIRRQSSCTCRSWTLGDGARTRRQNLRGDVKFCPSA